MHMSEEQAAVPDRAVPDAIDEAIVREVQLASGYVDRRAHTGTAPEAGARRAWRPTLDAGKRSPNPTRHEPPLTEPPLSEPPLTEPPLSQPPRHEPPRHEPPRHEPPRHEPPRHEPLASSNPFRAPTLPPEDVARFGDVFDALAPPSATPMLTGTHIRPLLLQFNLPEPTLARVWDVCNTTAPAHLTKPEFVKAMCLAQMLANGSLTPDAIDAWE